MTDFEEKLRGILKRIADEQNMDVFLQNGPLEEPQDQILRKQSSPPSKENALLVLSTIGGDAHVAYRIARHLQRCYKRFSVYIHTKCKSAGTLLAIGANEIIMSDFAEMGPLDVQLLKTDEIGERSSGLTINEALSRLQSLAFQMFEKYFLDLRFRSGGQISTKSASEIAANITIGLFDPVYSQIDPMRLGEINRAVRVALDYGNRIGKENLKPDALAKLVVEYPDHAFVIDRREAGDLFKNVRNPSDAELALAEHIEHLLDPGGGKLSLNLTKAYLTEGTKGDKNENGCDARNRESPGTEQRQNGADHEKDEQAPAGGGEQDNAKTGPD